MICDFSKKVIESACFFVVPAWHLKSQQGTQKNCAPEFLILSALKLTPYGLVVFVNMKIYILTEGKNFKTFLKENYEIGLNSCYIFNKKMLNM